MAWTKEELKKIRKALPKDGRSKLAEQFELAPGSLRNILSGLSKNDDVIMAAIDLAKAHQELIESKKATADTL